MAETFGKTDEGSNKVSIGARICMSKHTSGSAGTLKSLSVQILYQGLVNLMKCAIYDASLNLLTNGTTEERSIQSDQDGWMEFDFPTPPEVAATTDYYLAFWIETYTYTYRDPTGGTTEWKNVVYDGWPNPFVDYTSTVINYSIFATYEEAVVAKTLIQAALISAAPLILLPTLHEIAKFTGPRV